QVMSQMRTAAAVRTTDPMRTTVRSAPASTHSRSASRRPADIACRLPASAGVMITDRARGDILGDHLVRDDLRRPLGTKPVPSPAAHATDMTSASLTPRLTTDDDLLGMRLAHRVILRDVTRLRELADRMLAD